MKFDLEEMMSDLDQTPLEILLRHTLKLANKSLDLWPIPEDSTARLINVSENITYLIQSEGGFKAILRVHRENYHSKRAIECELAWIQALAESGSVVTPGHYLGKDGEAIQIGRIDELNSSRYMVLFHFVEGVQPDETGDLLKPFEELGELAAKTHVHSINWEKPENFERLTWDFDAVFGKNPTWGNWRDGPEMNPDFLKNLESTERTIKRRLEDFGMGKDRFGLIHADMRLANLLIDKNGTRLIDFDDCGLGWYLYDFAAAISFFEDDPRIPDLKKSWVRGYRKVRSLSEDEEIEIDTFVMMRRLALLAWIGSHIEAPEAQELAPGFAKVTNDLAISYMDKYG